MKLTFLPLRNGGSALRFALLLLLLAAAIVVVIEIHRLKTGSPAAARAGEELVSARLFEAVTHQERSANPQLVALHALYGRSLVEQGLILSACADAWEKSGIVPTTEAALIKVGISSAAQIDPWGHAYRLLLLRSDFLIVQSTGPSGQDDVPWNYPVDVQTALQSGPKLMGDNLVVGLKLRPRLPGR